MDDHLSELLEKLYKEGREKEKKALPDKEGNERISAPTLNGGADHGHCH
jgi:hypothetical protein